MQLKPFKAGKPSLSQQIANLVFWQRRPFVWWGMEVILLVTHLMWEKKNLSFSPHSLVSPSSSFHDYVKGSGSCNRHAVKLLMGLKGKGEKCLQSLIVIATNQQSAFSAVVMKTWPTQSAWCSCSCSSSSKNEAYIMYKYVLKVIISHFYQQLVSSWGCHFHSV